MIQNIKRASCEINSHNKESFYMTHLTYFLNISVLVMWMQMQN